MRFRDLLRRELAMVAGSPVTWLVLAHGALLVGHSFVLAIDLFSAASRSALGYVLMAQQMDPLAGVVRPTLGGVQIAFSLLVPVAAVRGLAAERERGSFGALAIATKGTTRLVAAKAMAAASLVAGAMLPAIIAVSAYSMCGGRIDACETTIAFAGHALHGCALVAISVAAGAASTSVGQATALALAVTIASWAIDPGEGFAALSWLGRMDWLAVDARLLPFDRGVVSIGAVAWLGLVIVAALGAAFALARYEAATTRWARAIALMVLTLPCMHWAAAMRRGYDWSEQRRASLPPSITAALRAIDRPMRIEIFLDRDDGRRAQLERDALAKLQLARPDLGVATPLDDGARAKEGSHDEGYGRIVVDVGGNRIETRSTSRKELALLFFDAAKTPAPAWEQPVYAGHPFVVEGSARSALAALSYGVVPAGFLVAGALARRARRRKSA